jgi:hypothetical protein
VLTEAGQELAVVFGAANEDVRRNPEPAKLAPSTAHRAELDVAVVDVLDDEAHDVRKFEGEQVVSPDCLRRTAVGISPFEPKSPDLCR